MLDHILYIEYIGSLLKQNTWRISMAAPVSVLTDFVVVSIAPISDSIKKLEVIMCDLCKIEGASHDIYVRGIEEVAFLKRCCDHCVKMLK